MDRQDESLDGALIIIIHVQENHVLIMTAIVDLTWCGTEQQGGGVVHSLKARKREIKSHLQ